MNKNLKLAVCGDSWFSTDMTYPGTSFGEILCKTHNWELLSLARCGASNFAICLQIDKAIELQSDLVLIGTTSVDRIEVPILNNDNKKSLLSRLFENPGTTWTEGKYKKNKGVSNILYSLHSNETSSAHDFFDSENAEFMSDLISCFLDLSERYKNLITNETIDALKSYVTCIYDPEYKRQIDSWIISEACRRLQDANIPFLLFAECMHDGYSVRPYKQEYLKDLQWISPKNLITADEFSYHKNLTVTNNACYHYDKDIGGKQMATFVEQKLHVNNWL